MDDYKHKIFGCSSNGDTKFSDCFTCVEDGNPSTTVYVSNEVFDAYLANKRVNFRLLVEVMDSVEYDDLHLLNGINVSLYLVPEYKSLNPRFRAETLDDCADGDISRTKQVYFFEDLHLAGIEVLLGGKALLYTEQKDCVLDYNQTQTALDAIANIYQSVGNMIGFWLDRYVNRAGNTGWDYLDYFCGRRKRL